MGQRGSNRTAFGRSGISACVIGRFVRYWQSDAGRKNAPVDRWRNSLRLATFKHHGRVSYGAVTQGGIVDLGRKLAKYPSLLDLLRANAVEEARAVASGGADFELKDVELLPPVLAPEKI